ncbi:MAG TPA: hypothetical protein VHK69_00905, partial [Chitinophagaceae bacterium]|nr:hypothetical protein [Chitinophagaceae bacterium]
MKLKVYILFVLFTACLSVAYAQQSGFARFIENKGQWDKQVRYLVELAAGNLYIHPDGFTVVQHNTGDWARLLERAHGHNSGVSHDRTAPTKDEVPTSQRPLTVRSHAYRVRFANANPSATLVPDKPLPGHANYFIGNDPAQWATQVKHFGGITIKNLYNGIDARYYTQNGKLKYDLMVHPGADPSQIVLRYDGADKLEIKNKELVVRTSVGDMRELAPYSYQYDLKGRREVPSKYVVQGNEVRFELKAYDPKSMLVIDPTLVFASFSGSASDNWGFTATYGPDGSMYGGGIVAPFSNGTGGFPTSPGAFQSVHAGGTWDIGLIKLTPDGSNRVYATYLGGSGVEQPHSLVVDAQGNLIMAGRTESSNFPADVVVGSTTNPDYDIVVVKLSPDGSSKTAIRVAGDDNDGVNIAPTREGPQSLQRNYGDDGRSEVILDNAGNIYVASATQSDDFPRGNSGSNTYKGKQDGVLLKFPSNLSSLLWTHFIGGTEDDAAYVLSISPITGNIYVAGGTKSTAINTTPGVISPGNNGDIDGFITAVRPDGTSAGLTTFLGTTNIDQIYGIQFDRAGFPYVMGQTYGSWPVLNAPFSQAGGKQFIA